MNPIEMEIKRIAVDSTKDVLLKVTSGVYSELITKLRKLERTVETLHHTTTEIKAEMVDVTSKSREATQDTDLEQNGASLNIHLETSTTKHSSSYRESPKSLVDQMERSRKRNSERMEENSLIKGMFSKNTKKKRKIYLAWEERMAHLLKLNCLTWKGENVIEISRAAVEEMFPAENNGRSLFQFQRIYGKKGDQSRFDISYDKIKVRMKHRCLKKESILSLYSDRDDGITTDEFINISEDSLENLFKD